MSGSERGAALVITLMITALVAVLGGALLLVTSVENAIEAHHRRALLLRQSAEAGLACAVAGLRATPAWSMALLGVPPAAPPCLQPAGWPPPWPGGQNLDPATLTAALQAGTDTRYGASADTPIWTLWLIGVAPTGAAGHPPVVLTWIADDVDDGDGDPLSDTNALIWVRVVALGPASGRSTLEALVQRVPAQGGKVSVIGWRTAR